MAGTLKNTIEELAHEFALAIEREVRVDMVRRLSREDETVPVNTRLASPVQTEAKPRKEKPTTRNYPEHCIYPKCHNPHRGPGSSFLCSDHIGISAQEKAEIKAARISAQAKAFLLGNK